MLLRAWEAVSLISSTMNIPQLLWVCFNPSPPSSHFFPSIYLFLTMLGWPFFIVLQRSYASFFGVLPMAERLLCRSFSLSPQYTVPSAENTSQCIKIVPKIVPHFRRAANFKMHVSTWREGSWVQVRSLPKQNKWQGTSSTDLPLPADG